MEKRRRILQQRHLGKREVGSFCTSRTTTREPATSIAVKPKRKIRLLEGSLDKVKKAAAAMLKRRRHTCANGCSRWEKIPK
jgi:hypothetical protein